MGSSLDTSRYAASFSTQRAISAAPMGGAGAYRPRFLYGDAPAPAPAPTYAGYGYPTAAAAPSGASGAGLGAPVNLYGRYDANTLRQSFQSIMSAAVQNDLAGRNHLQALATNLNYLSAGQLASVQGLLAQCGSKTEQAFLLKAYAAGESWTNLVQYGQEMRGRSESDIVSRSTMRDNYDVIQQWQDACGPTLVQTAAGETDPRYAWELNKNFDLSKIDPYGVNAAMAAQQKQWLEAYGGRAVARGQSGGSGIALGGLLNDLLAPIVGANYQTVQVGNMTAAIDTISNSLANGYDVPLRISWDPPGGADSGHFILAMSVRGTRGSRELQIHDPWTGQTQWVSESSIASNSFRPIFTSYARLSHFYQPQATA